LLSIPPAGELPALLLRLPKLTGTRGMVGIMSSDVLPVLATKFGLALDTPTPNIDLLAPALLVVVLVRP
jgi:hypothetical protein